MQENRAGGETWEWRSDYGWRAAVSFASFFGVIVFIIVWLFFFAEGFSVYQNIAIAISAVLVSFAIIGATWATMWLGRRGRP